MDYEFIAKFICAIDDRIYQWLKQCSMRDSVIDTDISLVEFSSLLSDVQLNRFTYRLPPSIVRLEQEKKDDAGSKFQKKRKHDRAEMVRNASVVNEWKLRPSENWES